MKYLLFFCTALIFSCSSPRYAIVTDSFQIRQVITDDPLAVKLEGPKGEELRAGDVLLTERSVEWYQVKQNGADRYDLILTLKNINASRWRSFTKRNTGKEVIVLFGGKVHSIIPVVLAEDKETISLTIEKVAATEAEADRIDTLLKKKKEKK
jgi:hypothetical protein